MKFTLFGKAQVIEHRTDSFQWEVEADSLEEARAIVLAGNADITFSEEEDQHGKDISEIEIDDWEVEDD